MKGFYQYTEDLNNTLNKLNIEVLDQLYLEIKKRINTNNSIYILGNGGSYSNASHIAGDYLKTISMLGAKLRISNLGDNGCFLTAASNDVSYEDSYTILFKSIVEKKDLIIYLSGSGNSMNLVKCARLGKKVQDLYQVSITAYNGGALSEIVDLSIHCKISDMEIAEDCQLIIFHYLKQKIINEINYKDNNYRTKYMKRTMDDLVS